MLGNIAAVVVRAQTAPRLLRGTGSDRRHLLIVAPPNAACAAPFNTAIVRLARERANALMAEGKEVKFFCVGRKGYDQLRRLYASQIIETGRPARCAHLRFGTRSRSRRRSSRCSTSSSSTSAPCSTSRFRSVITQIPTAQQIIPPVFDVRPPDALGGAVYEYEPDEETILARTVAAQHRRADLPRAARKPGFFYAAQMSAMDNATRNAGDMIRRQTIRTTAPVRRDHQGTDRDHLRRRGAVEGVRCHQLQRHIAWPNTQVGRITQVIGAVVDVHFEGHCRRSSTRWRPTNQGNRLVLEVAQHLGENTVRTSPWTPPKAWCAARR